MLRKLPLFFGGENVDSTDLGSRQPDQGEHHRGRNFSEVKRHRVHENGHGILVMVIPPS